MAPDTEILVVEDSRTQAAQLAYILRCNGYIVRTASNGVEALACVRRSEPTLIISDIVMPEMDGYELCRGIKTDPELRRIPIVLLTGLSEPEDVFKALQNGADNFITKPYDQESLLQNVGRILANLDLRARQGERDWDEVFFAGEKRELNSSRIQVIDFLLSTYENALQNNRALSALNLQLHEALESIKILETNYRKLLESSMDAVVVVDQELVVKYANRTAVQLLAGDNGRLVGTHFSLIAESQERREITLVCPTGQSIVADMRVVEIRWAGEAATLAVLRDITEQVSMREELQTLSLRDELTGIYNRRGFCLLAEQQMMATLRAGDRVFLMYLDMDGMKIINDTLGHQEGDAALIEMAQIFQSTFRVCDVVGRIGGDEFAILGVANTDVDAEELISRLEANIKDANQSPQRMFRLSVSVGLVCCESGEQCALAELMEQADAAMYEHKRQKHQQAAA